MRVFFLEVWMSLFDYESQLFFLLVCILIFCIVINEELVLIISYLLRLWVRFLYRFLLNCICVVLFYENICWDSRYILRLGCLFFFLSGYFFYIWMILRLKYGKLNILLVSQIFFNVGFVILGNFLKIKEIEKWSYVLELFL